MSGTTLGTVIDGVIALALIAATTVLLALHDLDSTTALALYGVAITLVGGSAKTILALKVPAPSQAVTSAPPAALPPPGV